MLSRISTPAKILFSFVFLTQFVEVMYSAFEMSPPFYFELLYRFTLLWLLAWWLTQDSRRLGITWPVDTGMWLYVAWIFLLPYHLFKTRGPRAFIPILALIAAAFLGWLTAAIVIYIGWYL